MKEISPAKAEGIKEMGEICGNLAKEVKWNQEDESTPGRGADGECAQKKGDRRGDLRKISLSRGGAAPAAKRSRSLTPNAQIQGFGVRDDDKSSECSRQVWASR